jgi:hypothetical protein
MTCFKLECTAQLMSLHLQDTLTQWEGWCLQRTLEWSRHITSYCAHVLTAAYILQSRCMYTCLTMVIGSKLFVVVVVQRAIQCFWDISKSTTVLAAESTLTTNLQSQVTAMSPPKGPLAWLPSIHIFAVVVWSFSWTTSPLINWQHSISGCLRSTQN